jgi:cell division protease FtsH
MIDSEVQRIITEQYERAQRLLADHRVTLANLTDQLLLHETLDGSVVRNAVEEGALAR